jgi:hypothetical protein
MIQDLVNEHMSEVVNLLGSKYGLNNEQASSAAGSITNAIGSYFTGQLDSGKLDFGNLADLLNKNTPNQSNAIFSDLSPLVSGALSKLGLSSTVASQISSHGLNDIIGLIQSGKLGNLDMGTITQIAGALTGKGGLSGMLGELGGMFGKK